MSRRHRRNARHRNPAARARSARAEAAARAAAEVAAQAAAARAAAEAAAQAAAEAAARAKWRARLKAETEAGYVVSVETGIGFYSRAVFSPRAENALRARKHGRTVVRGPFRTITEAENALVLWRESPEGKASASWTRSWNYDMSW